MVSVLYPAYLVEIRIEDSKDVPMVFEVINDRGEQLKPYEVLKGALLGQLDKSEIPHYYQIWQLRINQLEKYGDVGIDTFFRFYFRSKLVDNAGDYRDFDGDYHKRPGRSPKMTLLCSEKLTLSPRDHL